MLTPFKSSALFHSVGYDKQHVCAYATVLR